MRPAVKYSNPGDLGVILCLFNIGCCGQKRENFAVCEAVLRRSGIPVVVVDCAFGNDPWVVEPGPQVLRVRTTGTLWQKERLINLGLALVPDRCTKVAWVDADILFENAGWAMAASERLEELAVVQLADRIIRLPQGASEYTGDGALCESFAAVYAREPNALLEGDFGWHGHTGFAWAARRSVLEVAGLYDACVTGGGDHVMAHAFCGDWESLCLTRMMGPESCWQAHAAAWSAKVYPLVRARVGVVEGTALHLWHGELASRKHVRRYEALREFQFDPARDLKLSRDGCWEWASGSPVLQTAVAGYLAGRARETENAGLLSPL